MSRKYSNFEHIVEKNVQITCKRMSMYCLIVHSIYKNGRPGDSVSTVIRRSYCLATATRMKPHSFSLILIRFKIRYTLWLNAITVV